MTPQELEARAARHRRAALSPAASVPQAAARRRMHQGPGAGLGAQPLLLSGDDPDQGREPDRALRGSGDAPRMAQPPRRSRRRARRRRRHRALAQAHRRARPRPRLRDVAARPAAGDEICRRSLCAFRAREDAARSDRLVAHRIVLAANHQRAHRRHAQELRFRHRRDAGLFLAAPAAGRARFPLCARLRQAPCAHARRAAAGPGRARIQMRRAMGDAGRALSCLCGAGPHSARRLRAEG